jgi:hypothetical protein
MQAPLAIIIALTMLCCVVPAGTAHHEDSPCEDGGADARGGESPPESGPAAFTENRGQWDGEVRFGTQGGRVWFADDGVWLDIREEGDGGSGTGGVVLKQEFVGSDGAAPRGYDELPHRSNFYIGDDPALWRTNVPNFEGVLYKNVYQGIDARYHWDASGLKYDLIVHPGADPSDITLSYKGAEGLSVDDSGRLVIQTEAGELMDGSPYIYQDTGGGRRGVDGSYEIKGGDRFGFDIGEYDDSLDLVIDRSTPPSWGVTPLMWPLTPPSTTSATVTSSSRDTPSPGTSPQPSVLTTPSSTTERTPSSPS